MADVIKLVNATKLDADLTNVSKAIKDLDSSFGSMSFPSGMIENLNTVGSTLNSLREDNSGLSSQVDSLTSEVNSLTSENANLESSLSSALGYIDSSPHYTFNEGSPSYQLATSLPVGYSDSTNSISNFLVIVANHTLSSSEDSGHYVWNCSIENGALTYETIMAMGRLHTESYGDQNLSFSYDYKLVHYNNLIYITTKAQDYNTREWYDMYVGWSSNQFMYIVK